MQAFDGGVKPAAGAAKPGPWRWARDAAAVEGAPAAWLVWTASALAPALHGLSGVSTARLHRRRYSAASWPADAACAPTPGWLDEQPDASVVDGLPLVSEAVGALLPDVALLPVAIEGGPLRFAVVPRVVVDALPAEGRRGPRAAVRGLALDPARMAAAGAGVVGVEGLPNVVLVREDVAQRLWESGASGVEFAAPEAFAITFGALSPAENARFEALLAEAREAATRVAGEVDRARIGDAPSAAWLRETWAYRGVPHFAAAGMDPGEFSDEVEAAWREALAAALARG